jgi:hypothetical protein
MFAISHDLGRRTFAKRLRRTPIFGTDHKVQDIMIPGGKVASIATWSCSSLSRR